MSEPVSDDELESLTEWASAWISPEDSHWSDVVKVVAELQARRAAEQSALPAVEEMAERIALKTVDVVFACYRDEVKRQGVIEIRPIIAAALAPLYARLEKDAQNAE